MKDGEIAEQGTYAQLMSSNKELFRMMNTHAGGGSVDDHAQDTKQETAEVVPVKELEEDKKPRHVQIKSEDKTSGKIQNSVFVAYVRNFGTGWFVGMTVVALLFTQVTRLANDLWLVSWTQNAYPGLSRDLYMGTYAALGLGQALALLIYSVMFAVGGIYAAKRLHEMVLERAVASPVGFFGKLRHSFSRVSLTLSLQIKPLSVVSSTVSS
ncbi:hypothetical protein BC829DRAFT_288671 [Chytridium lagenaria]|nr:hypothetical protein BC829DRAFT_288671 [Chytridium lagenaria]